MKELDARPYLSNLGDVRSQLDADIGRMVVSSHHVMNTKHVCADIANIG
jgi:hypothetical protein